MSIRPGRRLNSGKTDVSLAHHYRRYGVGMIYLKLRQARWAANDNRVERLYQEGAAGATP